MLMASAAEHEVDIEQLPADHGLGAAVGVSSPSHAQSMVEGVGA
jgi:hypothetical protein